MNAEQDGKILSINGKALIGLRRAEEKLKAIRDTMYEVEREEAAWAVQLAIDAIQAQEPVYEVIEIGGARIVQQRWTPERHRKAEAGAAEEALLRQIGEVAKAAGAVKINRAPAMETLKTADPEDIKITMRCTVIRKIETPKEANGGGNGHRTQHPERRQGKYPAGDPQAGGGNRAGRHNPRPLRGQDRSDESSA